MKKILIVEDHADMRELLTWQIELMGFMPIPAKHGKEGVEKAVAEQPDLILLDIMMPGMDGWEAARTLRANPEVVQYEFVQKVAPRLKTMYLSPNSLPIPKGGQ